MASASEVKSQLNPEAANLYGNVTDIMRLVDPELYNNMVQMNGEYAVGLTANTLSIRASDKYYELDDAMFSENMNIEKTQEKLDLAEKGHHKTGFFDFKEEQDGLVDYNKKLEDLKAQYANNYESAPGYAELMQNIANKETETNGYKEELNRYLEGNKTREAEMIKQKCYSDYFRAYESGDVEKLNELAPKFSEYMSKDLAEKYPMNSPEYGEAMSVVNRLQGFGNEGKETEEPKTEEPKAETPAAETPKVEEPKTETTEAKVEAKDVSASAPNEEVGTLEQNGKPNPYAFEKPPCPSGMPSSAYDAMCAAQEQAHIKEVNAKVADEIWNEGKWGNGQERIDNLTAAGYDVAGVQAAVNEKIAGLEQSGALKQDPVPPAPPKEAPAPEAPPKDAPHPEAPPKEAPAPEAHPTVGPPKAAPEAPAPEAPPTVGPPKEAPNAPAKDDPTWGYTPEDLPKLQQGIDNFNRDIERQKFETEPHLLDRYNRETGKLESKGVSTYYKEAEANYTAAMEAGNTEDAAKYRIQADDYKYQKEMLEGKIAEGESMRDDLVNVAAAVEKKELDASFKEAAPSEPEPVEGSLEKKEIGGDTPPQQKPPMKPRRRVVVPQDDTAPKPERKEKPVEQPAASTEGLSDIPNSMRQSGAFLPDEMPSQAQAPFVPDKVPQGQGGVETDGKEQGKGGVKTDGKEQGKGGVDSAESLYIDESELGPNGKNGYINESELGPNAKESKKEKKQVSSKRFDSAVNLYGGNKDEVVNDNDFDPMDSN